MWYWLVILGVLIVLYVVMLSRQKKQQKQTEEMLTSLRPGDKVVTHIGVYGKIKRIYETTYGRVCLLEIGTKDKIEIEMDMRYVAGKDEKTFVEETKLETKEEPKELDLQSKPTESVEQDTTKDDVSEQVKEVKKQEKKTKKKSTK